VAPKSSAIAEIGNNERTITEAIRVRFMSRDYGPITPLSTCDAGILHFFLRKKFLFLK
jgi:hypothetical protein